MHITPGTPAWYDQVQEEILEPERRIIDPHHHLWFGGGIPDYLLADLWADTGAGHNVQKTVFIECGVAYRQDGPEDLRSLGETEFAAAQARESAAGGAGRAVIAGIVSHFDLTLTKRFDALLELHLSASQGQLRGIRHAGARHPRPAEARIDYAAPAGLFLDPAFQAGVRQLARQQLTYESWHYHTQLADFYQLARAAPETMIILDHFGTPLGTGSFRPQRAEIYTQWKADIRRLAQCPNVVAKLGGLAQPENGFDWHTAPRPPSSVELLEAQAPYYLHTIECFGPARCMFESNFPVDKLSLSYSVLWNAFKKLVADFSESEKDRLFYGTAAEVYRI